MRNIIWSVTVPTYNAAAFIEETIESVIAQNISSEKMEIIIVDNCSTDNTVELVNRLYGNRVNIIINNKNIGVHGNFNKCIEVANGNLVHMLHADDIVKKGFYSSFEDVFNKFPSLGLVCCNAEIINEKSKLVGKTIVPQLANYPSNDVSTLTTTNSICTPAVVVRKEAYSKIGGFDTQFSHVGDWDMWTRIIHDASGMHLDESLCKYREHSTNGSSQAMVTGSNILDTQQLYKKFERQHYPTDKHAQQLFLSMVARMQYLHFVSVDNQTGMENNLRIYKRLAGSTEAFKLAARGTIIRFLIGCKKGLKQVLS